MLADSAVFVWTIHDVVGLFVLGCLVLWFVGMILTFILQEWIRRLRFWWAQRKK